MTASPAALPPDARAAVRWRAAGLVGGKAIAVARSVALARLLSPDDFGLYALAFVALDLLLGVTDVGMAPALVQRAAVDARDYDAAWTVGLARGLLLGAVLALGAPLLAAALGDARATGLLRALALRPVLVGVGSIGVARLERELRYRPLALLDLGAALAGAALAVALAPALGVWALVAGTLGGAAVGVAGSYALAPHRPRLAVDPGRLRELLGFGRWILAGGVVAMLGEAALRVVIARALGTDALGRYALSATLAALPGGVVGSAVGAVAFSVHARVRNDPGESARAFRGSVLAMTAILLPGYAVLVALAPPLVAVGIGPAWTGTALVIRLLSAVAVLGLLFDATVPMLQGRGSPRAAAMLHAAFAVVVVTLTWPLAAALGLDGAALARLAAELAIAVGCVALARRALDAPFAGLARPVAVVAVVAAVAAAAAALIVRQSPTPIGLALAAAAAVLLAALLLAVADARLALGLLGALPRAALVGPSPRVPDAAARAAGSEAGPRAPAEPRAPPPA